MVLPTEILEKEHDVILKMIKIIRALSGKIEEADHKERNVLRYIPHHSKEIVAEALKNIYSASSVADATKRKDEFCAKWRKVFPSAIRSLETDFEDSVTFLKFKHFQIRKLFCSNNPIERVNKEIKRRVRGYAHLANLKEEFTH